MKKTLVFIAPAALLLAACAGASTSTVTVTEQKTVPAPAVTVTESVAPNNGGKYAPDMFFDYIHGMLPETFGVSNDGLLDFGDTVCSSIDSGVPITSLVQIGLDNGLTSDQISTLIAASVMFLCPENEAVVNAQLGD